MLVLASLPMLFVYEKPEFTESFFLTGFILFHGNRPGF